MILKNARGSDTSNLAAKSDLVSFKKGILNRCRQVKNCSFLFK